MMSERSRCETHQTAGELVFVKKSEGFSKLKSSDFYYG